MPDKHHHRKNTLLFLLLIASMAVSSIITIRRLEEESSPVSLPVTFVNTQESAVEVFRREQDDAEEADLSALREISQNELLDASTREAAASQLQDMIHRRELKAALEAALSTTALAPCAVVLTDGSVTVITGKDTLTPGESAMVVTLAHSHAGVEPSGVRVITNHGR